jgi:two-component system CheB/CheR fusion protein
MRVSLVAQSTLKFHRETGSPRITLLSEVLDSVLTMFRGKLQTMGVVVTVDAEREFPIACMPSETQQIFANFIANSIEAMQPKGRIAIRLRPSRDWRNAEVRGMRVTICDNGAGISRASLCHIFEPFFTTKPETGTGLGLWVVAELVERQSGSVHVRSSQKRGANGTVFSIFLPERAAETSKLDIFGDAGVISSSSPTREAGGLAPGIRRSKDPALAT